MKLRKRIFIFIILPFLLINQAQAALLSDSKLQDFNNNINKVATSAEYNTAIGFESIISKIIQVLLSILGVIFLLLMFMAGNGWMQAAGNEEKVKKSKETIRNLVIGLALVLIAYALSSGLSKLVASALLNK